MPNGDPFTTVDQAAEFYAAAYRKFIFLRGRIDPSPNEILNPSEFRLTRPRRSLLGEVQAAAADDFARLAANRVNGFVTIVLSLRSWQVVMNEYDERAQLYLGVEFVWPLLQLGIAEPSAIRNQIAFSVIKSAILLESSSCDREIPKDDEIVPAMLDDWVSAWEGFQEFKSKLRAVNCRRFIRHTKNWRNRRQHAVAPSPFGIVPAHVVARSGKDWTMTWAHHEHIDAAELTSRLAQQHVAAFELVHELRNFLASRFDHKSSIA